MSSTMSNFTYIINLEKDIDPFYENKIKKYEEKNKQRLAKKDIDVEIFKEGLYDLGITHEKYNYAYLSLDISNKELISIGGINKFKYLQNINVSYNSLTSLEQLNGLNNLRYIDASFNKITQLFDFE